MNDWHSIRFLLIGAVATIVVASSYARVMVCTSRKSIRSNFTALTSIAGDGAKGGFGGDGELLDMVGLAGKDHIVAAVAMVEIQMAEKVEMVDVVETQDIMCSNSSEYIPRRSLVTDSVIE